MAAALMNRICAEFFEAQSAGLGPGTINLLVIERLGELGIDISGESQAVSLLPARMRLKSDSQK
jgi:hypothetical protein